MFRWDLHATMLLGLCHLCTFGDIDKACLPSGNSKFWLRGEKNMRSSDRLGYSLLVSIELLLDTNINDGGKVFDRGNLTAHPLE
jgi:hypothetical protein